MKKIKNQSDDLLNSVMDDISDKLKDQQTIIIEQSKTKKESNFPSGKTLEIKAQNYDKVGYPLLEEPFWKDIILFSINKCEVIEFSCWKCEKEIINEITEVLDKQEIKYTKTHVFIKGEITKRIRNLLTKDIFEGNKLKWNSISLYKLKEELEIVMDTFHYGQQITMFGLREEEVEYLKEIISSYQMDCKLVTS